jgi:predicted RNA polymerase sigma factor
MPPRTRSRRRTRGRMAAWARDGVPHNPGGWLNTVARRIAVDRFRRDRTTDLPADLAAPAATPADPTPFEDDTLRLIFTCCHPALPMESRTALALRTLGGLTTREIARAYLEPEPTTAQRLVRAKRKIRDARIPYEVPRGEARRADRGGVLEVLYLIFNEGYASTDASSLTRPDLVTEGLRLARLAARLLPSSAEAAGLLALMLLTDARRPARLDAGRQPRTARGAGPRAMGCRSDCRGHAPDRRDAARGASRARTRSRPRSRRSTARPVLRRRPTGARSPRSMARSASMGPAR